MGRVRASSDVTTLMYEMRFGGRQALVRLDLGSPVSYAPVMYLNSKWLGVGLGLALALGASAARASCDYLLNESRRSLFQHRLTDELRALKKTGYSVGPDEVGVVRALFRGDSLLELDDDTARLREAISTDVLETRLIDAHPRDRETLTLAKELKLFGRALAAKDGAYLVAVPPARMTYHTYYAIPLDLYFVWPLALRRAEKDQFIMELARVESLADERAFAIRRRVHSGVFGVTIERDDEQEYARDLGTYLIMFGQPVYAERVLQLNSEDLLVHPSLERATQAF